MQSGDWRSEHLGIIFSNPSICCPLRRTGNVSRHWKSLATAGGVAFELPCL